MKQIAILILSIICFTANAQTIKISELPEHTGNPSTAHAPIVIGGVTKKYSLGNFVFTGSTYSNPAWLTGLHPNKLLQAGATSGQVLTWNGSAFVPSTIGGALPSQSGNAGKYLTTNGTTASWATISSVSNIGNSNLRLTSNRILSGADLYTFKFDSTRGFKIASILGDLLYIDQYGLLTLQSSNASEDDIPTRVTLSAQEDTATFTFTESTKIKAEKVNPNNGSSYKLVALNDATKEFETVASVNVDTTNRTTGIRSNARAIGDSLVLSAAINAKPNFGDVRDHIRDSLNAFNRLRAGTSAGGVFQTNTGATSFSYGAGGSTQVSFNGFAGYDANRNGSMTDLSFTNKIYVDSSYFKPLSDTTITGNYTLTQRDLGRSIYCTNTSLITITIPTGLTTGLTNLQDRRYNIGVYQEGTGNGLVQFTGSGVTIQSTEGAVKTRVANSYAEIKFKTDAIVKLVGDII